MRCTALTLFPQRILASDAAVWRRSCGVSPTIPAAATRRVEHAGPPVSKPERTAVRRGEHPVTRLLACDSLLEHGTRPGGTGTDRIWREVDAHDTQRGELAEPDAGERQDADGQTTRPGGPDESRQLRD